MTERLEVLCARHGWEPEDADCSTGATSMRLVMADGSAIIVAGDGHEDFCSSGHPGRPFGQPCGPCEDEEVALR